MSLLLVAGLLNACGGNSGSSGGSAMTPQPLALPSQQVLGAEYPVTVEHSVRGDFVRITSINGRYSPTHAIDVYVRPGDVVSLSADVFLAAQGGTPANRTIEAFAWNSSLGARDECRPNPAADCLKHSNFQVTNYGVAYYTPYVMNENIQIVVSSLDPGETDNGGRRISDRIILHNMAWDGRPAVAPPTLLSLPSEYPAPKLDPSLALIGAGRWVTIEKVRYFTPYTYVTNGEDEWAPYRHGYWAYENTGGFTWISYDPWGWMTDRYGVWRHHGTYGWLWLPFVQEGTPPYEPHGVSWLDHGDYLGWYPYNERYASLYRFGASYGFDDGFWLGMKVGVGFGGPEYRYRPGFAIIPRNEFANSNLVNVIINRTSLISATTVTVVSEAFAQNRVFAVPGGGTHQQGLAFVQLGGVHVPLTTTTMIATKGGAHFLQPHSLNEVPPETLAALREIKTFDRPLAIGSVIQTRAGNAPQVIPPTTNGRGLVAAPLIFDKSNKITGSMPIRTNTPALVNPENPVAQHHLPSTAAEVPAHQLPGYNPEKSVPAAIIPKTLSTPASAPKTPPLTTPKAAENYKSQVVPPAPSTTPTTPRAAPRIAPEPAAKSKLQTQPAKLETKPKPKSELPTVTPTRTRKGTPRAETPEASARSSKSEVESTAPDKDSAAKPSLHRSAAAPLTTTEHDPHSQVQTPVNPTSRTPNAGRSL